MSRLLYRWQATKSSFWFAPALVVLGAVALACAMIMLDRNVSLPETAGWSPLFGAGAAGSRGLLTAVATSMITVAGVVFSITIVALSLTSSQYTSRILVNFMGDRINQVVLGVFVGTFAYCLVVLRTIRAGDEGAFVPSLSVLVGLLLAFVAIGFLIHFIHHVAVSIQASSVIAVAAQQTIKSIDELFPEAVGTGEESERHSEPPLDVSVERWCSVGAAATGYIESVSADGLLSWAVKHDTVVRMERAIGEFVVEGTLLASVAEADVTDVALADLNAIYAIGRHRTVQQDAGFGVRQIVDVAMKALSPGVNDTTTAVMCVDYLTAVLIRSASRRIAQPHRFHDGKLRVIARGTSFQLMLVEAFDQIRRNAEGNSALLLSMLRSLKTIAARTEHPRRRRALAEEIDLTVAVARRAVRCARDSDSIDATLFDNREPISTTPAGAR